MSNVQIIKNFASIKTQWEAMLQRGTMPLFEVELKDGEWLLVDIELDESGQGFRFSFDSNNLKTWFSGDVKQVNKENNNLYMIKVDEWCDSLDAYLENISQEINEGFICPNQLWPDE